jgi:hypothetical protein
MIFALRDDGTLYLATRTEAGMIAWITPNVAPFIALESDAGNLVAIRYDGTVYALRVRGQDWIKFRSESKALRYPDGVFKGQVMVPYLKRAGEIELKPTRILGATALSLDEKKEVRIEFSGRKNNHFGAMDDYAELQASQL